MSKWKEQIIPLLVGTPNVPVSQTTPLHSPIPGRKKCPLYHASSIIQVTINFLFPISVSNSRMVDDKHTPFPGLSRKSPKKCGLSFLTGDEQSYQEYIITSVHFKY